MGLFSMTKKKISSNIIYSIATQMVGVLVPLLLAPYVARVFNAELIGDYTYTLANSTYFVLFECLGFGLYGMIRCAKVRDNIDKLSQFFWEIFYIKIFFMLITVVAYLLFVRFIAEKRLTSLYLVMVMSLLANGIDVTWFFNALEEFQIIAIRTICVRIVNVILVFLFVKTRKDLLLYAIIMQGSILVSYVLVLSPAMKRVVLIKGKDLHLFQHVTPSMVYFVPGLVNTIFSSTDKSVLGAFSQNSYEVGVYEQANKICQLCMGLVNAISNVILPRVTYMYANQKEEGSTDRFVVKSIRIPLIICLPLAFGIFAVAPELIPVFLGSGYDKSVILLRLLSLNVLSAVISNFIAQQCLIARDEQRKYNIAIIAGAILNVFMNILLVNRFLSVGVAAASVISSMLIFAMIIYYTRHIMKPHILLQISWKYIVGAMLMLLLVIMIDIPGHLFLTLIAKIVLGILIYTFSLIVMKDDLVLEVAKRYADRRVT